LALSAFVSEYLDRCTVTYEKRTYKTAGNLNNAERVCRALEEPGQTEEIGLVGTGIN